MILKFIIGASVALWLVFLELSVASTKHPKHTERWSQQQQIAWLQARILKHMELRNSPQAQSFVEQILQRDALVPDQLDWRQFPARVSRVKNQGDCGSCWAHSAIGVLEGQMKERGLLGQLVELSEQQLLDCDANNGGCNCGLPYDALESVAKFGGLNSRQHYPYRTEAGACQYKSNASVIVNEGAAYLARGDEHQLQAVVAKFGPVSVSLDAISPSVYKAFESYRGGVYSNENCASDPLSLNHAMLVVGYGTDELAGDFWILKNSWGVGWGEKGYMRLARNRNNMCGIATAPVIATFGH